MEKEIIYKSIVGVIRDELRTHGVEPDAEANTLSVYYKLPPDGFFQNTLRIANHVPTAQRMFGRDKKYFPSNDDNGTVTLYIHINEYVERNLTKSTGTPDYLEPKKRTTEIRIKLFERICNYYQKDADGNLTFPYIMYLFDSGKFFNKEELVHTDALESIGDSCYDWLNNKGKRPFVVPENAMFAFMQKIECVGILKRPVINEFKTFSRELDFNIGQLVVVDDAGTEVDKLDVILRVKDLPTFMFKDFIKEYGLPVSNNFKQRKMIELDTVSQRMGQMIYNELIAAGFPESDIAMKSDTFGLLIDIRDNASKDIFVSEIAELFNMSYVDVCKKYGI